MVRKLKDSKRWLNVTLRAVGDAVIAVDDEWRVCFMNPVAEHLTGWRAESALGRELADVLRVSITVLPRPTTTTSAAAGWRRACCTRPTDARCRSRRAARPFATTAGGSWARSSRCATSPGARPVPPPRVGSRLPGHRISARRCRRRPPPAVTGRCSAWCSTSRMAPCRTSSSPSRSCSASSASWPTPPRRSSRRAGRRCCSSGRSARSATASDHCGRTSRRVRCARSSSAWRWSTSSSPIRWSS